MQTISIEINVVRNYPDISFYHIRTYYNSFSWIEKYGFYLYFKQNKIVSLIDKDNVLHILDASVFFLDVPVLNCRNKNYPESPVYIFVFLTSYNVVVLHTFVFAISSVLYLAVMSAFLAFISFISVSSSRSWDLIKSSSFRLNVLFTVTWKEKTLKDIVYVMYNECFSLNSRKITIRPWYWSSMYSFKRRYMAEI